MAKAKYQAQNLITGLTEKDLNIGDLLELDEKKAEPFVATGSLVQVKEGLVAVEKGDGK